MRSLRGTLSRIQRAQKLLEVCDAGDAFKVAQLIFERRVFKHVNGHTIKVRARLLHNHQVELRPGTSDAVVFWETFVERRHLPPPEITRPIRRIWDLGANIGLTVADFAATYPEATITGVELDEGTAGVARNNIAAWQDRCSILTGAVWISDGYVNYEIQPNDEYGAHVKAETGDDKPSASAPSFALNSLLKDGEIVDYMKIDIEGAEKEVLRMNTEWLQKVKSIKVEVHGDYMPDDCQRDLRAYGFATRIDSVMPANVIIGLRI